jgi:glycosyltransferase involved in cell wall biosynthesis
VELIGGWFDEPPPSAEFLRLRELFPGAGLRGLYASGLRVFLENYARGADLIHIHLSRDHFTNTALDVLSDLPIVVQPHGMISSAQSVTTRAFDLLFKRRYLRTPLRWFAITDDESRDLIGYGVPPSDLVRVENAVEEPIGVQVDLPHVNSEPTFSFISRLHPRKQPDVFVKAATRSLSKASARFRVVGPDQGSLAAVSELIRASEEPSRFELVGAVDRLGAAAEVARADVIVLPSRGEIAPMIAIEAAAAGKAIILTRDCGIADAFAAADAALIVEPEVGAVAEAMTQLATSGSLRTLLGLQARGLFEDRWSLPALGETLEREYANTLAVARRDGVVARGLSARNGAGMARER